MRAALLVLAFLLSACRGKVSADECSAMLDRYVDMTIAADPMLAALPAPQASAAREMKHAVKRGERSFRTVQEQCEREVARHEYECAMDAKTPNDWEACID